MTTDGSRRARRQPVPRAPGANPLLVCALAWALPGAGHLLLGRRGTGLILLAALPAMFAVGLGLGGRLFPFDTGQILVTLQALAELGIGAPWFCARAVGWGAGSVVAETYEHGNTFLVAAGLLNILVVLDAWDIARGRK